VTGYGLDVRSRESVVGIATGYGLDVRSRDSVVGIVTGYGLDVRSRDSVVGIATGYGLDDRGVGVRVLVGARIFSSPRCPDWLWCPPRRLSNGYGAGSLSPWLKPSGPEGDHSPPTSAEVKKIWIYTSIPLYVFMA
jgi:hypothetical protein